MSIGQVIGWIAVFIRMPIASNIEDVSVGRAAVLLPAFLKITLWFGGLEDEKSSGIVIVTVYAEHGRSGTSCDYGIR